METIKRWRVGDCDRLEKERDTLRAQLDAANKRVAELEAIKWLDDFSDQQWLVHVEFLPEGPRYEASSCAATFRASTPLAALTGLVARLQKERTK